jgi:rare lipoprotein A
MGPVHRGSWLLAAITAITVALSPLGLSAESKTSAPIVQLGLASWYGPGFHGRETASGEIFDQREMVAAHRTLPLGSVIQVTNLENGRRLTVRVIDRGPYGRNYRRGTILDVSRGAARRLGFIRDGIVRVRIKVLALAADRNRRIAQSQQ